MERQTQAPIDWDLHRNFPSPSPASPERDQGQQRDGQNGDQNDAMGRPSLVLPSPPVPPPQPLWHQDLHHSSWPRHSLHRSELVSPSLKIKRIKKGISPVSWSIVFPQMIIFMENMYVDIT